MKSLQLFWRGKKQQTVAVIVLKKSDAIYDDVAKEISKSNHIFALKFPAKYHIASSTEDSVRPSSFYSCSLLALAQRFTTIQLQDQLYQLFGKCLTLLLFMHGITKISLNIQNILLVSRQHDAVGIHHSPLCLFGDIRKFWHSRM